MTEAEAQTYLQAATATVDALVECVLDHAHDAMVREGASEQVIDKQMQSLLALAHKARTETLIRMATIANKFVVSDDVMH